MAQDPETRQSKKNSPRNNSISEWGANGVHHTSVISSLGLNDQNSRRFNIDLRGVSKSMMANENADTAVTKHIIVQGANNDRASSQLSFLEYNNHQQMHQQVIASGFKSLSTSYDQSAQQNILP